MECRPRPPHGASDSPQPLLHYLLLALGSPWRAAVCTQPGPGSGCRRGGAPVPAWPRCGALVVRGFSTTDSACPPGTWALWAGSPRTHGVPVGPSEASLCVQRLVTGSWLRGRWGRVASGAAAARAPHRGLLGTWLMGNRHARVGAGLPSETVTGCLIIGLSVPPEALLTEKVSKNPVRFLSHAWTCRPPGPLSRPWLPAAESGVGCGSVTSLGIVWPKPHRQPPLSLKVQDHVRSGQTLPRTPGSR